MNQSGRVTCCTCLPDSTACKSPAGLICVVVGPVAWCTLMQALGRACCSAEPDQRPNFRQLVEQLTGMLSHTQIAVSEG